MSDSKRIERIIEAGEKAVDELIKVLKSEIITYDPDHDLAADKLKAAAATKKQAMTDAFDMLNRIQLEKDKLNGEETKQDSGFHSFVEGRTKKA